MSRAGWPSGELSLVKLRSSVSMSGPSATEKPMSAQIAVIWSNTWLIGWTRPVSVGGSRTGSVTSTVSLLRRWSRAACLSAFRRAAIATVTRSLRPLIRAPCSLRWSGVMVPSVFNIADTVPLLPSAATRTASSAASSSAAAIAARISDSSFWISVIGFCSAVRCGSQARSGRDEGPPRARPLRRRERQVGIAGLAAGLGQHAMHLAAMMGLVVEHVRDQQPFRLVDLGLDRTGEIRELAGKRVRFEPVGPIDDYPVEGRAFAL